MTESTVDQKGVPLPLWRGRLIAACVGLVLAVGYLWQALLLPLGTESRPGAGLFPVAVGVAFAVISVATGVEALRMRGADTTLSLPRGSELRQMLIVLAALVVLLALLPVLGLLLSGSAFAVVTLRTLGAGSWPRALLYGCGLGVAVYLVFVVLLEVSFPSLTGV
ncbi:tripartite tricarboxylate transporter TctB family protein [Actinophytocola sediminis]